MRISKAPEERRAELVAAARRLFDEKGVEKTRVSDIVGAVGVAQGVFYYYFKSKDELVEVVLTEVLAEIRQRRDGILQSEAGFCKRVAEYTSLYIDWVDGFLGDDETRVQRGVSFLDNELATDGRALLLAGWRQLVAQGIEQGIIAMPYPDETARVLLYGLEQLCMDALPSRAQIFAILEQGLGLAGGSLQQKVTG